MALALLCALGAPKLAAQPANVLADPTTGALFRPTGALLASGNNLGLTTSTLAQFAATTSAQLAGVISNETGSGLLVFATSPTLTTPDVGVASGTSLTLSSLTSGRVTFATANGLLTDDADFTFATDTLTATKGTFGGITHIAAAITAGASTDLTLAGGSSGASLVLGQGGSVPSATFTLPQGGGDGSTGRVVITNTSGTTGRAIETQRNGSTFLVYHNAATSVILGTATASHIDVATNNAATQYRFTTTGNLLIGGTTDISGSGGLKVYGTTAATSVTSGALQIGTGIGMGAGAIYSSTLNTSGAVTVGGALNVTGAADDAFNGTFAAASGKFNIKPYRNALFGTYITSSNLALSAAIPLSLEASSFRLIQGNVNVEATTEATTGGAGSLVASGGIYTAKKVITASTVTTAAGNAWNLGAAAAVSPTSPNRTIAVVIDGTTYYLHAKTTNN